MKATAPTVLKTPALSASQPADRMAQLRLDAMLAAVTGLCAAVPQNAWRDVTPEQIAKRAVSIGDAALAELHRDREVTHVRTR